MIEETTQIASEAAETRAGTTKSAAVEKLLSRSRGATIGEIMAASDWLPHSTRAHLSILRKKGKTITKQERRNGETAYRLTDEVTARFKLGTRLIREWRGEVHQVELTDRGYLYRDRYYASLSHIARLITGTQWSGPRFFGLTKTGSAHGYPQPSL